ncbi:MAG TPA: phenylalanine--tRNA ligase subunit beta, partial [Thiothrix sp.]|nr:phenylalanine--tRNA ligase subunit beta [Thiothrix sp.]
MKVSEQWLRQWVNPAVSIEALGHQLTMAGLELEGIEPVAATFSKVVIGQIEAVEQHPDADRLRVCQVNVGETEHLQIVTNVASVAPNMRVPVAMIGAALAGETPEKPFKIKKSKLRGVLSQGMFCGADTLGVSTGNDEGLLELPADAPLGQAIREYLQLDDHVLEIDLTPNRADCLSVAGIAREVGVLTQTTVTKPVIQPVAVTSQATFPVTLSASEACPHYVGRVIEHVNVQAQSPLWLTEALRRAGLRSISPTVDVTNYVMLELGQPLHAFDFACLEGGIEVRYAQSNEALTLLDGQEIKLSDDTLVIADQQKALALAGIMGGESSAVSDNTQTIFLESAFFTPSKIAGKARQYGLHTDSSHRFERGVAPDLQVQAIERASQLILEICGGQAGKLIDISEPAYMPQKSNIVLRRARIQHLLGVSLPDERVVDILQRLECKVTKQEAGWDVTPPL